VDAVPDPEASLPRPKKKGVIRRTAGFVVRTMLKLVLVLALFSMAQVLVIRFVNPPVTVRMAWQWASDRLAERPYQPPVYRWRPLQSISPHLRRAVLAAEDQRFLQHDGFDFIEVRKAFSELVRDHRIRGASTITMQVARTIYLLPSRSVARKLGEAWYTVFIELLWSKKRVLELYLNTVDWGRLTMGAEAASRKYFNCPAHALNREQAALLAAVLPNPHRWSPQQPGARILFRVNRILNDMDKMPLL
jgi:monofunctional glycosyltransferase